MSGRARGRGRGRARNVDTEQPARRPGENPTQVCRSYQKI